MQSPRISPISKPSFKPSGTKINPVKLPNVSRQLAVFSNNALRNLYLSQREGQAANRSVSFQAGHSATGGNSF